MYFFMINIGVCSQLLCATITKYSCSVLSIFRSHVCQWRAVNSTLPVETVWDQETLTVVGVCYIMCKCFHSSISFLCMWLFLDALGAVIFFLFVPKGKPLCGCFSPLSSVNIFLKSQNKTVSLGHSFWIFFNAVEQ